jgi:cytochrome c-type biogenesis protein CcmH/NrfG
MLSVTKSVAAIVGAICGLCGDARAGSPWKLARTEHFEVYSQSGDENTRAFLARFEQLRAFFLEQSIVKLGALPRARVIVFLSQKEFEPYRLGATSDAYYSGSEGWNYIVMAAGGAHEFQMAAHEFAHFVLHSSGVRFPPWLNEGLAEVFSTARLSETGCALGGELPSHLQLLRRLPWMPLVELLALPADSPVLKDRGGASLVYAQSWALAGMLVLSPEYGGRFPQLMAAIGAGTPGLQAFASIYGKSPEEMESDLRVWVEKRAVTLIRLPGVSTGTPAIEVNDVAVFESERMLADLLAASGQLERAEALYREVARASSASADVLAALGSVALSRGNADEARKQWKRAIEQGVTDAEICYRYALLADDAGIETEDIRRALQQAVALRPDFDDARYKLALLEKNAGRYEAALEQLRAMRSVPPARAFHYWSVQADALNELGRREEAVAAARHASEHAATREERAHADKLAYLAQTDMEVQFARDANGRAQMVTTRVPHETADWNPFVEAGDDLRRVRGTLREIDCGSSVTRLRVETAGAALTVTIADPSRVRMRNAPEELVCGPQAGSAVLIEYAASKDATVRDGLVRGIEFEGPR